MIIKSCSEHDVQGSVTALADAHVNLTFDLLTLKMVSESRAT